MAPPEEEEDESSPIPPASTRGSNPPEENESSATPSTSTTSSTSTTGGPHPPPILQCVPFPKPLELTGANNAQVWTYFSQVWQNYEIASQLNQHPANVRLATLLTCFGESAYTVYNSIKFDTEADKQKIDIVLTKLKDYCVGQTNEIYERYIFNRRIQEPNENIDSLLTALTTLSKDCNYGELRDSLIRDRIVFGIRD